MVANSEDRPGIVRGFRLEFVQLVIAGLVWVVGSAWNTAFQSYAQEHGWLRGLGPFVYAAVLTTIVGLGVYLLKRHGTFGG
tara:strand:+ start:136 stop:378 length:243 start_codon:yes stop_codon:yes gene_type:complete